MFSKVSRSQLGTGCIQEGCGYEGRSTVVVGMNFRSTVSTTKNALKPSDDKVTSRKCTWKGRILPIIFGGPLALGQQTSETQGHLV